VPATNDSPSQHQQSPDATKSPAPTHVTPPSLSQPKQNTDPALPSTPTPYWVARAPIRPLQKNLERRDDHHGSTTLALASPLRKQHLNGPALKLNNRSRSNRRPHPTAMLQLARKRHPKRQRALSHTYRRSQRNRQARSSLRLPGSYRQLHKAPEYPRSKVLAVCAHVEC
jgi:hypothetical protein